MTTAVANCTVCGIRTNGPLCLGCTVSARRRGEEIRQPLRKVPRGKRKPRVKPQGPRGGPDVPMAATERAQYCGVVLDHSRGHITYGDPDRPRHTLTIVEFDGTERTYPWKVKP